MLLRWQGHQAWKGEHSWRGWWPVRTASRLLGTEDWGEQPRWGWWPFGAIGWYRWAPRRGFRLNLMGNRGTSLAEDESGRRLAENVCYVFKLSARSRPGATSVYRMKVWENGEPEPPAWDVTGSGVADELSSGSAVLLAHHVDATFGDVQVVEATEG
jgi:hypothetical protein